MAWPFDARHETAVSGQPANPDTMNEVQDRICDLHTWHYGGVRVTAMSGYDGTGKVAWIPAADPLQGWNPNGGVGGNQFLRFEIRATGLIRITAVRLKYYNGHPTNPGTNNFTLYSVDPDFATPTNPPTKAQIATMATGIAALTWGVVALTGLTTDIDNSHFLVAELDSPMHNGNDIAVAVKIDAVPVPTP